MPVTVKHETGSVDMFRFMLKDNKIDLSAYEPPLCAKDLTFIEEMIVGTRQEARRGRGADKEFLYDIVNNTRSSFCYTSVEQYKIPLRARGDARLTVFNYYCCYISASL